MLDLSLPNLSSRVTALERKLGTPLNWRGAYVAGTVYSPNDVVTYGGVTFVSIKYGYNQTPGVATTYWQTLPGTDSGTFVNPMTTAGDIVVGGTVGVPTRLAKGADSTYLRVSPTTHLLEWGALPIDPGFANPMTTAGDIIVGGAAGVPTRLIASGLNSKVLGLDNTGALGYRQVQLYDYASGSNSYGRFALDYLMSTNQTWLNGVAYGAVAQDICQNQSFTCRGTSSLWLWNVVAGMQWFNSAGPANACTLYWYLDNVQIYEAGFAANQVVNGSVNPFGSGACYMYTGLSAGSHTLKIVVVFSGAGNTLYLRPQSFGGEFFRLQAFELQAN